MSPHYRKKLLLTLLRTELKFGNSYQIKYEVSEGSAIQLLSENFALETSWDDALPLSVDGIDALGGIYSPMNFELYEGDTVEKREEYDPYFGKHGLSGYPV